MTTKLKNWRTGQKLTLAKAAALLGLEGVNPANTYRRLESGERRAGPQTAEDIVKMTGGAVTIQDLHDDHLKFLRQQQGEVDCAPAPVAGHGECRP